MSQIPNQMLLNDIDILKSEGYTLQNVTDAWNYVPPTPKFTLGLCFGGMQNSNATSPQALALMKALGITRAVFWLDGGIDQPVPAYVWPLTTALNAQGIKSILIFQGNQLRPTPFKAAGAGLISSYFSSWPEAASVGVVGVSFLDEFDSTAQYNDPGNFNTFIPMAETAATLLRAKGYEFYLNNLYWSNETKLWYSHIVSSGLIEQVDALGYHDFEATAAAVITNLPTFKAFADNLGKPLVTTQRGLHMGSVAATPQGPQQITTLFKALAGTTNVECYFSASPNTQPAGGESLLNANGNQTAYVPALQAAL